MSGEEEDEELEEEEIQSPRKKRRTELSNKRKSLASQASQYTTPKRGSSGKRRGGKTVARGASKKGKAKRKLLDALDVAEDEAETDDINASLHFQEAPTNPSDASEPGDSKEEAAKKKLSRFMKYKRPTTM